MIDEFLASQNFFLFPSNATHHCRTSHIWLDLIITDDLEKVENFFQKETPFLSGHDLISFNYKVDYRAIKYFSFTYRDYKNFTHNEYLITLYSLITSKVSAGDDYNVVLDSLCTYRHLRL